MATFNAGSVEATLDLDIDPFQRGIAEARGIGNAFGKETFKAKLDADTSSVTRKAAAAKRSLEAAAGRYTATFETRGLTEAAASAAGLHTALERVDGRHTIDVNTRGVEASIGRTRRGIRALIPLLAILATGLTPLSAAAVPALGLLNNLTLSAAAAGSLILAFQGVGGAMEAIREAELDPTVENLEAAAAAMDALHPSALGFVVQLKEMAPLVQDLQMSAASGFFPSALSALERAETLLPRFNPLVWELASSMGVVADNTLRGLGSRQWMDFYDFAEREARPAVDALAQSFGNLAGGLAGMWEGFDPLNDDFSTWLINITQRFEDWGQTLTENEGMRDFVGYVREVGPEAAETLQAVGAGFSSLVQASAPLGGVVLDVLELIGNAVEFIAETPFGDELLLGAAAIYTINKALKITTGLLTRIGVTSAAGGFGALTTKAQGFGSAIRLLPRDLSIMASSARTAGAQTERSMARVNAATARTRTTMRMLGKGAAIAGVGLAALGVLGTEAGQGIGVTNTAMLGLAGYMIGGPWGAAAGAGAGYIMDIKGASEGVTDSIESWNQALRDNAAIFSAHQGILAGAKGDMAALENDLRNPSLLQQLGSPFDPDEWANVWSILSTGESSLQRMQREFDATEQNATGYRDAVMSLGDAFGMDVSGPLGGLISDDNAAAILERSAAAMQKFGVSYEDLANADAPQVEAWSAAFADWTAYMDSGPARMDAFAQSIADLGSDALGTADAADALGQAMDALLSPTLDAEAGTDAWRKSLQELQSELKDGVGFKGFSKAALENKELTRDYVETSKQRLESLAGVGTTTQKDMANAVAATRREFIRSGIAAGIDKKVIEARANALGLTPKLVKTVFDAVGIDKADLRARKLRETYKAMPPRVRTDIAANGIPKTAGDVDRLVAKYKLSEKQRTALVTLKDLATKDINNVLDKLGIVGRTNPRPAVNLESNNALGQLQNIYSSLNGLDGKTSTSYINVITTKRTVNTSPGMGPQPVVGADGMTVPGQRLPYADKVLAYLAPGEEVVTNRNGEADRFRADRAAGRIPAYANGGTAGDTSPPVALRRVTAPAATATTQRTTSGIDGSDIDRLIEAIRANRGVYAAVSSKEDVAAAMRALESELRR